MTHPHRQDFRLIHRLRVRWAEVDMQRIVFNPHYLMYIDTAFTEYWRALAVPYEVIPGLLGGDLYVKKSTLEYHGSARLDDMLDVAVKCAHIGTSSMRFLGGVFRGEQLLVSGELTYVFADPVSQTSKPVPPSLRELLNSYEAGATPTELQLGAWSELGEKAGALRTAVFMDELRIALELGHDIEDMAAVHALLCNRFGQPLATGRLTREAPGEARISRVAVSRTMRSTGLGTCVMRALMGFAAGRGDHRIVLSAEQSAQPFYTRLGFVPMGEPFEHAGVRHVEMACDPGPG